MYFWPKNVIISGHLLVLQVFKNEQDRKYNKNIWLLIKCLSEEQKDFIQAVNITLFDKSLPYKFPEFAIGSSTFYYKWDK